MDDTVRDIDGTEIFVVPESSPAAAAVMPELVSATSSLLANDALALGMQIHSPGRSKKRKHIGGGAIRRVSVTAKTAVLATHVGIRASTP